MLKKKPKLYVVRKRLGRIAGGRGAANILWEKKKKKGKFGHPGERGGSRRILELKKKKRAPTVEVYRSNTAKLKNRRRYRTKGRGGVGSNKRDPEERRVYRVATPPRTL